jgi:hypothetical protein
VWADDPKGYLLDNKTNLKNYSSGTMWLEEFDEDERAEPEELIARSHYGDLQFFHGMAIANGVKPEETLGQVLFWAEFLVDVATARVSKDTLIKDAVVKHLFPKHEGLSIRELFVAGKRASEMDIRQRAAGVLLHLIQDSYAAGHVQRDPKTGAVEQFHAYGGQSHEKHGAADTWTAPGGKTLEEVVKSTPGAQAAVDQGVRVLVMLDEGRSTADILKFLREEVFALSPAVTRSGSGTEFKK